MQIRILQIACIVIFVLTGQLFSQQNLRPGASAPQFSGTSFDGVDYDLAKLKGKVVVLTFWSTRCEVCRVELPRLDQLVGLYDPDRVVFLALTTESDEVLRPYLRTHPFRFKTVANSFGTLLQYADRDRSGSVTMLFPSFFVIGPDGRIAYRGSGYGKTDVLSSVIGQFSATN